MSYHAPAIPAAHLAGGLHAAALGGGGGLGRLLIHLFIWRLIWRGGLALWRVPTVGPALVVVLGLVVVALIMLRAQLGPRWWQRRGGPPGGRPHGGSGPRYGASPRDW